jgi:shikimate kinase
MNTSPINKRIFLIGMPGCGKTSAGKKLAKKIKLPFFDLDKEIEKAYGSSIPEIFKEKGEAFFRTLESEQLEQLIKSQPKAVIACGGGTPVFHQNIEKMKEAGLVIYLELSLYELEKRLQSQKANQRPLLNHLATLSDKLFEMYEARKDFYAQADISINANQAFDKIVDQSIERIENYSG